MPRFIRAIRRITYEGEETRVLACIARSIQPGAPKQLAGCTISAELPQIEEIERPAAMRTVEEEILALRSALADLVRICDTEAMLSDGSSPDTRMARSLLERA